MISGVADGSAELEGTGGVAESAGGRAVAGPGADSAPEASADSVAGPRVAGALGEIGE